MKRIVIKVGSAILTEQNRIAKERMLKIVELIAELKEKYEVILVSSGSVAAGYTQKKVDKKILGNTQALAAIGQPLLMAKYQAKFERFGILCAQVLLTRRDFDSRKATAHAKRAVEQLLSLGVVPIINENDTTAIKELVFGDNDQLSAHAAHYFKADLLVILSDIDALYDKDPRAYNDAKPLKHVSHISQEQLEQEVTPNYGFATGGIVTKLKAADFLLKHEGKTFLSSGLELENIKNYLLCNHYTGGTLFSKEEE